MTYLILLVFAGAACALHMPWPLAAWYLVASGACFALYAADKSAARAQGWRTPERTLLLTGLAGGWPGALLAQRWLRHKSSKTGFLVWSWLTVLFNAGVTGYLLR